MKCNAMILRKTVADNRFKSGYRENTIVHSLPRTVWDADPESYVARVYGELEGDRSEYEECNGSIKVSMDLEDVNPYGREPHYTLQVYYLCVECGTNHIHRDGLTDDLDCIAEIVQQHVDTLP